MKDRIINVLFKQLGSDQQELMKCAEECINKFLRGTEKGETPIETDVVHHAMRPTLLKMGDYRLVEVLKLIFMKKLTYVC